MLEGKTIATPIIRQRLDILLAGYWLNKYYVGFSDSQYYCPSPNEIELFVDQHPIGGAINLGEGFDCDDYTFVFKGNLSLFTRDQLKLKSSICAGIAWGRFSWRNEYHAANWFMDRDSVLWWIEPQDGVLYPINECVKGSLELLIV